MLGVATRPDCPAYSGEFRRGNLKAHHQVTGELPFICLVLANSLTDKARGPS